jgi:DDE superfamily endonuclease
MDTRIVIIGISGSQSSLFRNLLFVHFLVKKAYFSNKRSSKIDLPQNRLKNTIQTFTLPIYDLANPLILITRFEAQIGGDTRIEMPRKSKRAKYLTQSHDNVLQDREAAGIRYLLDIEDEWCNDLDMLNELQYEEANNSRYLFRLPSYKLQSETHEANMEDIVYSNTFSDDEFLEHFRMRKDTFLALLERIVTPGTFERKNGQGSAEVHLLALLKYLGSNGTEATASKMGRLLRMSKGTFFNYVKRMKDVLLQFEKESLFWPEEDERQEIAARVKENHHFPNCVGFINGTLLPLETKPQLHGEDYFSRKGCYAINALITCDDVLRIRNVVVGWPGSVHDNRVWQTSLLCVNSHSYFSQKEYLLGDSAFSPSNILVPAYKKSRGLQLQPEQEYFNSLLAKPRVRTEHCIGLLKGRFPFLKHMRVCIRKKKDLTKIIELFTCACILHNWLIKEPYPLEWVENENDTENDEWNLQGTTNNSNDER